MTYDVVANPKARRSVPDDLLRQLSIRFRRSLSLICRLLSPRFLSVDGSAAVMTGRGRMFGGAGFPRTGAVI